MKNPRNAQREFRNLCLESRPVFSNHLIAAAHGADRGLERCAAGVLEPGSRFKFRLLTNDAFPADFLNAPVGVGNDPVSTDQLRRDCTRVRDLDRVGKHITRFIFVGAIRKEKRFGSDINSVGWRRHARNLKRNTPILQVRILTIVSRNATARCIALERAGQVFWLQFAFATGTGVPA